jgi:hypothetical protein
MDTEELFEEFISLNESTTHEITRLLEEKRDKRKMLYIEEYKKYITHILQPEILKLHAIIDKLNESELLFYKNLICFINQLYQSTVYMFNFDQVFSLKIKEINEIVQKYK